MSPASDYQLLVNANLFTPLTPDHASASWQHITFSPGAMAFTENEILASGPEAEVLQRYPRAGANAVIDAGRALVTPGFVDCHTHPVFYNHRAQEFEMRVKGASYVEISQAGGGIRFSVRDLRAASEEALLQALLPRLDRFFAYGTTTIEAKSGYGLSTEAELKSLRVLQQANELHALELVPTFLGAHEIPDEYRDRREAYLALLENEMIPAVAEQGLAEFIDVFCESHVYTAKEARRVLLAGRARGLRPKIHADQLHDAGGAEVATEVQAVSADHLEHTPPELDARLARAGVVPVMLPGADFFLASTQYGPARRMIAAGLPVALATDFNPGTCMCESMQMMLTLAALYLKMTPAEGMIAATLHAARAIAREDRIGSLEPGKQPDFVLWHANSVAEVPYHYGVNSVHQVYKRGNFVYQQRSMP